MAMHLLLSQIAELLSCDTQSTDVTITGATIDSRKVQVGNLFIALKGEHVDGHNYIAVAREAGASAALVATRQEDILPQLVVTDVVKAFGVIAAYWRQQCKAQVVAITGSNGKTTVKEMVAAILAEAGSVIATQGNLNNQIGVPLTLSRLDENTDYAVIEMGTNNPGEIAYLVEIVKPDVAIINNVAVAHLQGLHDLEGVATEKSAIYSGLNVDGVAVINADMSFAEQWKQSLVGKRTLTFALENDADITAQDLQLSPTSSHFMVALEDVLHYVNLHLPGKHNVANALAAIAVTNALNTPVSAMIKGLSSMKAVPHRMQLRKGIKNAQILDDSYNANPDSYQQALATLNAFAGERWLVLGDFGELGIESKSIHRQLGLDAKAMNVAKLFTVGDESRFASDAFGYGAEHFETKNELQQKLLKELTQDVTCLIKGSRFMQLDKLADSLTVEGED